MVSVDKIMQYEDGEMGEEEMIEMFQEMINDGSVWVLQGSYGRMAAALIRAGVCSPMGKIRYQPDHDEKVFEPKFSSAR